MSSCNHWRGCGHRESFTSGRWVLVYLCIWSQKRAQKAQLSLDRNAPTCGKTAMVNTASKVQIYWQKYLIYSWQKKLNKKGKFLVSDTISWRVHNIKPLKFILMNYIHRVMHVTRACTRTFKLEYEVISRVFNIFKFTPQQGDSRIIQCRSSFVFSINVNIRRTEMLVFSFTRWKRQWFGGNRNPRKFQVVCLQFAWFWRNEPTLA